MSVTYVSQPPQFDISEIFYYIVLQIYYKAPWCSGLTCHPVTVEIRGSNPLGVASSLDNLPTRSLPIALVAKSIIIYLRGG